MPPRLNSNHSATQNFTPGPWEAVEIYDGNLQRNELPRWKLQHTEVYNTDGMTGAGIVSASQSTFAYLRADAAHAALIAAAPELYEVLETLVSQADAQFAVGDKYLTVGRSSVDVMRAALAKAAGR